MTPGAWGYYCSLFVLSGVFDRVLETRGFRPLGCGRVFGFLRCLKWVSYRIVTGIIIYSSLNGRRCD